jgi:hypothetical protein
MEFNMAMLTDLNIVAAVAQHPQEQSSHLSILSSPTPVDVVDDKEKCREEADDSDPTEAHAEIVGRFHM